MEGLIFTVYKALKKKNKAQKHYDCLSDEATPSTSNIDNRNDVFKSRDTSRSYNINDFYPDGYNYHYVVKSLPTSSVGIFQEQSTSTQGQLKRHNSVKGYNYYPSSNSSSVTTSSATTEGDYIIAPKQMRRSWSHILFPSCVSGT